MAEEKKEKTDFISLMKKKRIEEGKPSVIGEALENAEKAEKKAADLELENLQYKKENEEYKQKNEELVKKNASLKENLDKTIGLLSKSEEAINEAIEEKKQLEIETHKQIQKMEFELNDLKSENNYLKEKIKKMEMELNALSSSEDSALE